MDEGFFGRRVRLTLHWDSLLECLLVPIVRFLQVPFHVGVVGNTFCTGDETTWKQLVSFFGPECQQNCSENKKLVPNLSAFVPKSRYVHPTHGVVSLETIPVWHSCATHSSPFTHGIQGTRIPSTIVDCWFPPWFPPSECTGNAVQAVCTQCKLLFVGNHLNPRFGPFSRVCYSMAVLFFTLLVHSRCGTFEMPSIVTHF